MTDDCAIAERSTRRTQEGESIMKLSARNVLTGNIIAVTKGVTTANVKLDLGHGVIITSSITMEAAKELKLKKGDTASAIIKASEVIVGKE